MKPNKIQQLRGIGNRAKPDMWLGEHTTFQGRWNIKSPAGVIVDPETCPDPYTMQFICTARNEWNNLLDEIENLRCQLATGGNPEDFDPEDPWLKQLKLRPQCEEALLRDDSVNMIDSKST